ncbi:MAG: phenylacetate--CoA ligase family protein [Parcubacteria group bacterium]|nr:phenylacetate--CoA ligase family protein [Parcubacteria group bacterium]
MLSYTQKIAKHIICNSPLSVEAFSRDSKVLKYFDKTIQNWALAQSDFFSESDWKEIQLIKLKKILTHAGSNVPYWRRVFKETNFNPETFKDFSQLQKIPLITRTEIKKNPIETFVAKNIPRWRFREAVTSGSTGEPLKFYQDLRDNLRREVNTSHELRYSGNSYHGHIVILGLESHHDLDNFGGRFSSTQWGDYKFRQSVIYPYLKLRPATLIANGSDLRRFLFLTRKEAPDIIFKTLMYRGEHISELERNNIFRFFKCPTFTCYGSRETSLLGIECEYRKLHLAPWMNYFEVVSDGCEVVPDGCEGNVVVTFFENFTMPFIRYRIGDRAVINNELCSCGRKSKTITLYGRESEIIQFPNSNKNVSVLDLALHIDEGYHDRIAQYQFELRDKNLIVFRYIPNIALTETEKKHLSNLLYEALKRQFQVILEEVATINPSANGKTPILIRNL